MPCQIKQVSSTIFPDQGVNIYQQMTSVARQTGAVNLSQGIPERIFDKHWRVSVAQSLDEDWQYTPTRGLPVLQQEIIRRYGASDDLSCIVTTGCTEALLIALIALRAHGVRQVVTWEPFYSYYPGIARLAGCELVASPLLWEGTRFRPDWLDMEQKLAGGDKALLLNSPHNPTGLVLKEDEWTHIETLCRKFNTALLVDDVYREFSYTHPTPLPGRFMSVKALWAGSVSKMLAGTGVRIGWLVGEPQLVDTAHDAHMHLSNCLPATLQLAAARLIKTVSESEYEAIRRRYQHRRDCLRSALQTSGFICNAPDGGHFIIAELPGCPVESILDICVWIAKNHGITPLPLLGFFHGKPRPWIRFSFAVTDQELEIACERLAKFHVEQVDASIV